jgi:predicted phage baseplate assembly protein
MALEPIQLDTLNWDQIVSGIRTRIPADSQGKWTLHAPVDPGVTLLELFAWLLEQRVYWMDQIPDSLILATLKLLGQELLPAKPAVTLIQLSDDKRTPGSFTVVSPGTVMRRGNVNPPLLFTLEEDVAILPSAQSEDKSSMGSNVAIIVDGVDRSNDLRQGRAVPVLAQGAESGSVEILLTLEESIPGTAAGGHFAFLIELENPAEITAEWLADPFVTITPPATLHWSYTSGAQNQSSSIPSAEIKDGTSGLRRSGVVRLPIPKDWQPEPAPVTAQKPVYKLVLGISGAKYTVSPRLLGIFPNVAHARHVWSRTKQVKTKDWLPIPGNVISLSSISIFPNLQEYGPLEDSVKLRVFEPDGQWHEDWTRVGDFSLSGPGDRGFLVDRQRGEIRFGDGLTGRLPVLGQGVDHGIQVSYLAGAGPDGNVGTLLDWEAIQSTEGSPRPSLTGVNLVPGEGGAESESLLAAQRRTGSLLRERNRAVTGPDYENLVQTTPGVGFRRAHAQAGFDPEFPCTVMPGTVSVFVVPYAPREETDGSLDPEVFVPAPEPDPGALASARKRLNQGRLIGTQAHVLPPVYRSVWLEVEISSDGPLSSDLREKVALRLRRFLDPLVGGSDGSGWPFGDPIRPTALVRQAQIILGDGADVDRVGVRISGFAAVEDCLDVRIGLHELPKLEQVLVRTRTRPAVAGGLQ